VLEPVHARLVCHVVGIAAIEVAEPRPLPHDVRSDPRPGNRNVITPAVARRAMLAVGRDENETRAQERTAR